MTNLLGNLVHYLRKAFPLKDYTYGTDFRRGCATHWFYTSNLNQIIIVKFPTRHHYISKELARKYLQASRKLLDANFSPKIMRDVWVLNILISDRLTKSSFELTTPERGKNRDMLFSTKNMAEDAVLCVILKALSKKWEKWHDDIIKSCSKPHINYRETPQGALPIKKKINPYGDVKEKIANLDKAIGVLKAAYYRLERNKK